MLKVPVEDIVERIRAKTGLSSEIITKKIDDKVAELSGLVSRDGAAHIVANEFGVQLFKTPEAGLAKVKDVLPGLKSVSLLAKVLTIYPTHEFKTAKREGKVASFLVGDETGKTRIVFWDTNLIKMLEDGTIKPGDVIKITNCYAKESRFSGGVEVHAGNRTKIDVNPGTAETKKLTSVAPAPLPTVTRKNISELSEGTFEIRGAIVHISEAGNGFFEVCPTCNRRAHDNMCKEHGQIKPNHSMIISAVVDDGSSNMRVVFFGNKAEQLLGTGSEEAFELGQKNGDNFFVLKSKKQELLGKEIICEGQVSTNGFSEELEMICRKLTLPEPTTEAKRFLEA
jgi:ssDNA-binding replication factor A large subunit